MSRRGILIGAAGFAAAVAIVLVLLIALGGDDEETAETAPHGPPTTGVTETTGTTDAPRTQTAEALTDTGPGEPNPRTVGPERAVFSLVAAVEAGNAPAGVHVSALPSSDELSVERTRVAGDRATVTLAGDVTVRLRRSGGAWRVVAVQRGR
jgi:hypothetical protein